MKTKKEEKDIKRLGLTPTKQYQVKCVCLTLFYFFIPLFILKTRSKQCKKYLYSSMLELTAFSL